MNPRVSVLTLACLLLWLAPAHARSMTQRERSYVRTLSRLLDLKPQQRRVLEGAKSGAVGVRVSYLGLEVSRLYFPNPKAAHRFATARLKDRVDRQRVDLRKQEVLVLRGLRLSNAAFAKRATQLAWDASTSPPSGPEEAEGLTAQIGPKSKRAPEVAPRPVSTKQDSRAATPDFEVEHPDLPDMSGEQARPGLKAPSTPLRPRVAPPPKRIKRPLGVELDGAWATLGKGTIHFRLLAQLDDTDEYSVTLKDFGGETPRLIAVVRGRRVTIRLEQGLGSTAIYDWRPSKSGGRFVRVGLETDLLPRGIASFWRPAPTR